MRILKSIMMILALMATMAVNAQAPITSVHGSVSDDMGPLMGATVCEIDGNGRIIESTITDLNGNFTMRVRNPKDRIRFSYVGMKTITQAINKTTFNIRMQSATQLKEVTIKSQKRVTGNGLPIPQREVANATQTFSMKEVEGMAFTTVDEALQGRIAGLDIISNSGDLGSGSTMRLRGASTLSTLTDSNPLIVVDGNVRSVDLSSFDMNTANNERFAELLNINPEDISDIRVLKDAAATAIYGSQGGNGVIELTTKRGSRGKPHVTYTLKLTATHQPAGYDLLRRGPLSLYGQASATLDLPLRGKLTTTYFAAGQALQTEESRLQPKSQWSLGVGMGLQYNFTPTVGLFAEPTLRYHFNNGDGLETWRTSHPAAFSLPVGIRINF